MISKQSRVTDVSRELKATLVCAMNLSSVAVLEPTSSLAIADLAAPLVELINLGSTELQATALEVLRNLIALGDGVAAHIINRTGALHSLRLLAQTGSASLLPLCEATLSTLTERLTPGSRSVYLERSPDQAGWKLKSSTPKRASPLTMHVDEFFV